MTEPKSFLGVMGSSPFTGLTEHRKALIDLLHTMVFVTQWRVRTAQVLDFRAAIRGLP